MQESFKKEERLKKKKLIAQLFNDGKSLKAFPLKLTYLKMEHDSPFKILAGVSVPKKNFKKAVDRNKIKRLVREGYRINKPNLYNYLTSHNKKMLIGLVYIGETILPYQEVKRKLILILQRLIEQDEEHIG